MKDYLIPIFGRETVLGRIISELSALKPGKAYRVVVKEDTDDRTAQQCRYLNGVAYKLLGDFTGYERDDISEYLCGMYFGWREKKVPRKPGVPSGKEEVPVRTTTTNEHGERDVLSMDEFWKYVEWVQRFGAKYGVLIPDPDPTYNKLQRPERQQVAA